jgi:spermidine synthase
MTRQQWSVAGLLFFSGLCALVYQTVWMREFRLVFGASTPATAAVLAIFMAGLGAGSAVLGKRADATANPLGYYARLELFIAAAAALSPFILMLCAKLYFASGGSPALGMTGATIVRLILATLVLGPATFLMGGTLPAAARAAESNADDARRAVALLYGINTLGAVAGALLSTFVLVENLGNRKTLFVAVLVNVLVALRARSMAKNATVAPQTAATSDVDVAERAANPKLVYTAAALVGFAFLLMELVWYRMLSPILGGTTYMFGLVLAVALLGIGMGGTAYALLRGGRPATLGGFALTCGFEALAVAIPFAMGDRIAVFAGTLRQLGLTYGFPGHVSTWALVTMLVVFPAAFISGVQFPLLIALLGRGREHVGRQIGMTYAWNTVGAIVGSLAGGFGIMPLLSAPGAWRLVAVLLTALALVAAARAMRQVAFAVVTVLVGIAAIASILATGPSAAWRNGGVGVGRMPKFDNQNLVRSWTNHARRIVVWERDGRESSVALTALEQLTFIVNGKSDGSARGDAGTQIGIGLIPAILHPQPKTSLVIGLGTGQTAGFLTAVPSMQRVDAVELEPNVVDVARLCAPVNFNVLENKKTHLVIADAREVLLASDRQYDLIVSEPSNPYRAGIASLLTQEFYESVRDRLQPGGIFAQWMQGYGIDASTMQTVYATLRSTFPYVQTWRPSAGDLVMVASQQPITMDAAMLRARVGSEPYASTLFHTWDVTTFEGFLARFVANEQFAAAAAQLAPSLNTDDRTVIEFGFARSLGDDASLYRRLVADAEQAKMHRPLRLRGAVDWSAVDPLRARANEFGEQRARDLWAAANAGRGETEPRIRALAQRAPVDAKLLMGILRTKQRRWDEATGFLRLGFLETRTNPWVDMKTLASALDASLSVSRSDGRRAAVLYDALSQKFAVRLHNTRREFALISIAPLFDGCGAKTLAALHGIEPHTFWDANILTIRANCYALANDPRAQEAWDDLDEYTRAEPAPVVPPRKAR